MNKLSDKMFYNGAKLLSMRDLNNEIPEIYIVDSNRSAGKTTWFNHKLVEDFLNAGKKFCLLYRYKYELDDCADKFFNDIQNIFYPDSEFESKKCAQGTYHTLFLNGSHCGYALALNSADNIKRMSHMFSDTDQIVFDEFQPETGKYCSNEISKFISIHASLARGNGQQVKYLPIYLIGNCVTILNPYYSRFGITTRLKKDTKFLRGNGWVMEHHFNESASQLNQESSFNKAFADSSYMKMLQSKVYMNDDTHFIEKPDDRLLYLCTVKMDNINFSINRCVNDDCLYVSPKIDQKYPVKFSGSIDTHSENYKLLTNQNPLIKSFRSYFNAGKVFFKNQEVKSGFINLIAY